MRFMTLSAVATAFFCCLPLASAASCNQMSTFNALFDKLKVNSKPPDGFAYVNWTNFVVQPASNFLLTPRSSPNVAFADGFRSSLSFTPSGPDPKQAFAILKSFSFACVIDYPPGSYSPVSCNIVIVRDGTYPAQHVASFGPFTYAVNYQNPGGGTPNTFPMANVSLAAKETSPGAGGIEGTDLFFYVTRTGDQGPGGPGVGIVFDNMAIAKYDLPEHCG